MLRDIAAGTFGFIYGFANFVTLTVVAALRDGAFVKRKSKEYKEELANSQKKYWDLQQAPFPGFRHAFHALKNGAKLHYVINEHIVKAAGRSHNVAIFLHGFPDTYLLWKNILQAPDLENFILIAVDLPGYGGSDSLPSYGPDQVLEALASFILAMRAEYVGEGEKLVMVSHDWGGLISGRLASEAKELADRWIITSAIIPAHVGSNASTFLASSRRMIHTFLARPLNNIRLLKTAFATSAPVFGQLRRSYYIFIFKLPGFIANWFVRMGNHWFLGLLHTLQAGLIQRGKFVGKLTDKQAADSMAATSGPGIEQFKDQVNGQGYSESVRRRISDLGASEKIRLYREGLAFKRWEKSLETVVALSEIPASPARSGSGAGLFEEGPRGALRVPTTLILGKFDVAFERRLSMNGIGDFLVKGSQVLFFEKSAHWIPLEPHGYPLLVSVISWALEGEKGHLKASIDDENVQFVLEK